MAGIVSREVRLKRRPVGLPRESDFEVVEVKISEPKKGEVLVDNIYMSVDPYMRGRMIDVESYVPPFQLGEPLEGGCVGRVAMSNDGQFREGDYVLGTLGWRERFLSDGHDLVKIEPNIAPIQAYLGALGMTGFTAYVGILDIGRPQTGETVFVSAASGAVGSIVCQIAKLKGCRVAGSAGSEEKADWLVNEIGIDAAFNYKTAKKLRTEISRCCPDGIDVLFENVGGEQLQAILGNMNLYGRIVLCGMISQYNATRPAPGPNNLMLAVIKRLTLRGFIVTDHSERMPDFFAEMGKWIAEGKIKWKETIIEGIENSPKAFIGLFTGENFGKMLVRIGSDNKQ